MEDECRLVSSLQEMYKLLTVYVFQITNTTGLEIKNDVQSLLVTKNKKLSQVLVVLAT